MHNNLNIKRDDDLKFIPLSIKEPFIDKESSWLPAIDLTLPSFNNMPEGFVLGFSAPINNSNLEGAPLKTLDYIPNNSFNMQNGNIQNNKIFNEEFDLYYPSETLGEELFSYNKDEKCKQNNNSEDMNKNQMINFNNNDNSINNKNNNINSNNNSNNNFNNTVDNSGIKATDNIKKQELNMGDMKTGSNCECTSEPPHMELLRSLDFYTYLESGYRGEEENKIRDVDNIFNIIKEDKSIIDTLKAYNLPKPIYDLIIKKIIKITLENSKYKWGD